MILALNLPSEKPSTECPPRLKHRCNRSTVPGSCSPHAKPALAHCLCRQVKSRQWSTPLASSTGATEARFQDLGSQLAVRSCRSLWSSLTGFLASRKASTDPLSLLKAVNGVPLSPQAQVQPKHGSMMLAVSWQFDHAEACGPRSLAYSPHAKPALTPCLCRQVKSRQWIAPLASSTGATEARIFFPHSKFDTCCLEMRSPRFLSCLRWEFRN